MTNPISQIQHISNPNGQDYAALVFWCPGCEVIWEGEKQGGAHMLPITYPGNGRTQWTFSGSVESPTLSPSILSQMGTRRVHGEDLPALVCHSFMVDGQMQFLGDCTHALVNQTIPLPPLPDWLVK